MGVPQLREGTALLSRGPGALLAGSDPEHSILFTHLSEDQIRWLTSCAQASQPAEYGKPTPPFPTASEEASEQDGAYLSLISRLRSEGLLASTRPAPSTRLRVDVNGVDAVTTSTLQLLASLLPLHAHIIDRRPVARDVSSYLGEGHYGQSRSSALREVIQRSHPQVSFGKTDPHLALVASQRCYDFTRSAPYMGEDIPHLLLCRHEFSWDIGPLVVPGRTPCARCLELSACDLDPFHAQDTAALPLWKFGAPPFLATHLASGWAAHMVCTFAVSPVQAFERYGHLQLRIELSGRMRWRRIHAHAECGCHTDDFLSDQDVPSPSAAPLTSSESEAHLARLSSSAPPS